jgi:hypothetical protein
MVILTDTKKENVKRSYAVKTFPATFLVSKNGFIEEKWMQTALPAHLAKGIEEELGDAVSNKHFRQTIREPDENLLVH